MFADTCDAMTTKRPYRGPLGEEPVRAELVRCRGRQFDPKITDRLRENDCWASLFPPSNRSASRQSIGKLMAAGEKVLRQFNRRSTRHQLRLYVLATNPASTAHGDDVLDTPIETSRRRRGRRRELARTRELLQWYPDRQVCNLLDRDLEAMPRRAPSLRWSLEVVSAGSTSHRRQPCIAPQKVWRNLSAARR